MTRSALTSWLIAASLLAAGPALADDDKGKAMDSNDDGMVSASEHENGAKAMFDGMDRNKDRSVTAAEMDAAHAARGKPARAGEMSSTEKIRTIDSDGDGKLTANEHSAGSKTRFTRMDTDRDGTLSQVEWTAGHDKAMRTP